MIGKAILFAAKVALWLFVLFFVLGVFAGILVPVVQILFAVLTGWVGFLRRVLPEVSLNPSAIAFAIICSGLLLWGGQWFCGWLYEQFRSRQTADSPWPLLWPWRWTAGVYCAFWLLFLAAMSITGVVHQVGWLVRSDKPIIENRRPREQWEIKSVARRLDAKCGQTGWDAETVRQACEESLKDISRRNEPLHERWHMVFIETKGGATEAVFVAYRDAELRRKYGYHRVTPKGVTDGPIERLSEDIRAFVVKAEASAK